MNTETNHTAKPLAATLDDIRWMTGGWTGDLGPQSVEEAWSQPSGGTMATMVRLKTATQTLMIELIVIREDAQSLVLHLRQFSPALEERLAQDMPVTAVGADRVCFQAPTGSKIAQLEYRRIDEQTMEVDVTTGDGAVLTAALRRTQA